MVRSYAPCVLVLGPIYTTKDRVVGVVAEGWLQTVGINVKIDDYCSSFTFGSETLTQLGL